jgi:hypothetical protein
MKKDDEAGDLFGQHDGPPLHLVVVTYHGHQNDVYVYVRDDERRRMFSSSISKKRDEEKDERIGRPEQAAAFSRLTRQQ